MKDESTRECDESRKCRLVHHRNFQLKTRNDQKWETRKDEIRRVYMDMDHTLRETMKIIEASHHFTAR
jgi:hypothetical protein